MFENSNIANEYGFSLLETLIALAILSLSSLILFQSTSSMLSVSEKTSMANDKLIENVIARETFKNIISGLTPGWPNQEGTVFDGKPHEFSGLTTRFPSSTDYRMAHVSVTLNQTENNVNNLIVKSAGTDAIILEEFNATAAVFEYMGEDQVFYPVWPPEQLKNLGFANDASFMEVPDLPKLIRLSVETSSSESNNHVIWIASIGGETRLPYKDDLTAKKYDF